MLGKKISDLFFAVSDLKDRIAAWKQQKKKSENI